MSKEPLVASTLIDAQNPWPGLSSFDEAAQLFFSGRDAESVELLRLVGQAPLTVLFGKSGLGKTSLVQAGLFPRLRQQNILPVYVRLNMRDRSAPLIQRAAAALQAEISKHGVDSAAPNAGESLWEHLHGRHVEWWSAKNQPLTPIFVFDQFEEAFTLGSENADAIERLRLDLADLIENRIPADLAQRIEAGASVEHLDLRGQRYKMLISFREDFLPEVEGWKAELPSLMRNRLRLLPMSADRALQVVSGNTPTGRTHELVTDETAREIVRFVAAVQTGDEKTDQSKSVRKTGNLPWETLEIEPALLSLVCEGLNAKRKARGQAMIDAALLKETGAAIIGDFYQRCVADVPDRTRRFIEDSLITEGGFRNSYPLQDALDQGALTEPMLRHLVDRRLLRIDHQLGADRVELIHDRLTAVVREHRDKKRERIRAQRQRRMWYAAGSLAGVLIAIGLLFFFLWQSAQRSEEQTRTALKAVEEQKVAAENAKQTAETEKERADTAAKAAKKDQSVAEQATRRATKALEDAKRAQQKEALAAAEAKRAADAAQAALRETIAGKLVMESRAILEGQRAATTDVALLLAAAGYRLKPNNEVFGALQYALNVTPLLRKVVSFPEPVIAFSNDGTVVTAKENTDVVSLLGMDRQPVVRLWDAANGRPRGAPLSGLKSIPSIAFSPDGTTVVTGSPAEMTASHGESLRFWDASSGQPRTAPLPLGPAKRRGGVMVATPGVAFSPDGKTIAATSVDQSLRLWDVANGRERSTPLMGHTGQITALAFSPVGNTLVSGSEKELLLWDLGSGQPRAMLTGHKGRVTRVAFTRDGKLVLAGSSDGSLRLWTDSGRFLSELVPPKALTVTSIAFSPDGRTIVSGDSGGTLRLWDVNTRSEIGIPLHAHTGQVASIAFLDHQTLVSGGADKTLRFWDTSEWLTHDRRPEAHAGRVTSVAFSPDSGQVVSSGSDGAVRLWNATNGDARGHPIPGPAGNLNIAGFSRDADRVVSLSEDGTVRWWNISGAEQDDDTSRVDMKDVRHVAFSPDSGLVALGGSALRVLESRTGSLRCAANIGKNLSVNSIAFSSDSKTVVATVVGYLHLLDVVNCKQSGARLSQGYVATSIAISRDRKIVVSGSVQGGLDLWHSSDFTLRELRNTRLDNEPVTSVSLSPDATTVVSAGRDGTLRLWDVASGQSIGAPTQAVKGSITRVAFSPDGRTIVSGNQDGTLRFWAGPTAWIGRICAKLVRNLSRSEWKQYVGDIPYEKQCPELPVPVD